MIEKLKETGDKDYPFIDEGGCSWQSKKNYLQTEVLGFCGCGDPDDIMLYVKEFLEKLERQDWGKYEDRPYMFLIYWADHNGFTEHGTTARCSWLTDKGKELLNDINICITEEPAAK